MALIKSGGPRDFCYAAIRNISADKGSNITQVNIGLWYDAEDRNTGIQGNETLPPARDSKTATVQGYNLTLTEIYITLLTQPEWSGWASDEV